MEELRSTEVLTKEILEDARRKAFRILKEADKSAAEKAAAWEKKTEKALAELDAKSAEEEKRERDDIMARLPLDTRRIRSERIENLLREALDRYLANLPRDKALKILAGELARRKDALSGGPVEVEARGLSGEEAARLLAGVGEGITVGGGQAYPALVLDSPEVKITVSLEAAARQALLDARGELTRALVGPAILEEAL